MLVLEAVRFTKMSIKAMDEKFAEFSVPLYDVKVERDVYEYIIRESKADEPGIIVYVTSKMALVFAQVGVRTVPDKDLKKVDMNWKGFFNKDDIV